VKYYFNSLIFLILLLPSLVTAQEEISHIQEFTEEDGLSSTSVVIFFQDSRGIIWIGTSYGLNSYDGTTIRSFTKADNGLCHNYIHNIVEDGKGNLWILAGDYGRQNFCYSILDPITEDMYSIEEYTGQPCPFNPQNTQLYHNYKGTFLIKEILKDKKKAQFYEVQEDKIVRGMSYSYNGSLNSINPILYPSYVHKLDNENYVFISPMESHEKGFGHELYLLKNSGEVQVYRSESLSQEHIIYYLVPHYQHYYIYTKKAKNASSNPKGIPIFYYKEQDFLGSSYFNKDKGYPPFLIKNHLYSFYPDRIEKYSLSPDSTIYQQDILFENEQKMSEINFVDKGGNIWFSGTNAIKKLSFRPKNFKEYLIEKNTLNVNRPIRGITSNSTGTVFVGETLNQYINSKNISSTDLIPLPIQKKYGGSSLGLFHEGNKLWIGEERFGLSLFDLEKETHTQFGLGLIWQPYRSPGGTIWAGGGSGLFSLDTLKKDLVPFPNYGEFTALEKSSIYHFHLNEKGTWLSTSSGIYLADLEQKKILAHYNDTQKDEFYIPANNVAHLYEDKEGIFWLATKGQGLIRWNPTTGESEQLTKKNTGLSDKEGNLYFGTIDGMIEFHPRDFNHQAEDIPFIITAAHNIDQQTDSITNHTRAVLDQHSITIKPSDKATEFQFALLDYKKTKGNQYSYKIKGYRDKWIFQQEGNLRTCLKISY